MKAMMKAGLIAVAVLAAAPLAKGAGLDSGAAMVAAAPQAQAAIQAQPAAKADPRFAPYCLHETGSPIVVAQNHRAEREARANGTTPKLRCTGMGVALRVNADAVPVPDQGQPATFDR